MKTLFATLFALLLLATLPALAENTATLPAPALVPASTTTNLAAATYALDLSRYRPASSTKARIWATWTGDAASTNDSVVLTFVTKSPSGVWDNASGITLTKTAEAGATGKSDWFELVGVGSMALKSVANGSGGAITNLQLRIGFDNSRN